MNTQTAIFKSELLTDTADMIKAAGFKVYDSYDTTCRELIQATDKILEDYHNDPTAQHSH
jgi:hypothetical protein